MKRRYGKRRFSRKKKSFRRKRRVHKYDAAVWKKMTLRGELAVDATGICKFYCFWGKNEAAAPYAAVNKCADWAQYFDLYKYVCIKGCKMRCKIYDMRSSGSLENLIVYKGTSAGTSQDGTVMSDLQLEKAVDYNFDPVKKGFSKYVNVFKYRKRNAGEPVIGSQLWLSRGDFDASGNKYVPCLTQVNMYITGLVDQSAVASYEVDWYVGFKG